MRFCLEIVLGTAVLGGLSGASLPDSAVRPAADSSGGARAVWVVKVDTRTGKLVRTLVAPKVGAAKLGARQLGASAGGDVRGLVAEASRTFDVNPLLVDSVIQVESNYNPFAVSPKGAQGLMQLMPSTARRFGVTDSFDPKQNIEAGVRYLKFLEETFQDDRLAIAAYNAGEGAVAKYKDVPPYAETVDYVAKVGKKYGQAKRAVLNNNDTTHEAAGEAKNAEGSMAAIEKADEPRHVSAYVDPQGRLHMATR
jgi:soluble lytic murein transglycosylase-like protein